MQKAKDAILSKIHDVEDEMAKTNTTIFNLEKKAVSPLQSAQRNSYRHILFPLA